MSQVRLKILLNEASRHFQRIISISSVLNGAETFIIHYLWFVQVKFLQFLCLQSLFSTKNFKSALYFDEL